MEGIDDQIPDLGSAIYNIFLCDWPGIIQVIEECPFIEIESDTKWLLLAVYCIVDADTKRPFGPPLNFGELHLAQRRHVFEWDKPNEFRQGQ